MVRARPGGGWTAWYIVGLPSPTPFPLREAVPPEGSTALKEAAPSSSRSAVITAEEFRVDSNGAGGFTVTAGDEVLIDSHRIAGGWMVTLGDRVQCCRLVRRGDGSSRFALVASGEADPRASSARLTAGAPSDLVLADGRMFSAMLRGPEDPRIELVGPSGPGAYLVARPDRGGYRIERTVAGMDLEIDAEFLALFAAEVWAFAS